MGGNVKTNKRQECAAVAEHRPNELQPSLTLVSLNSYKTAPIIDVLLPPGINHP